MRLACCVVILLSGFTAAVHASKPLRPAHPTREVDLNWFFEAVRAADQLEVLEGLPHQYWEREERSIELAKHKTLSISTEAFYEQRLSVPAELRTELTNAFLHQPLFVRPLIGKPAFAKGCGGFHADYGLRWLKEGTPQAAALVCFGCGDIRLVGGGMEITTELTESGERYLKSRLLPLKALRPPRRQLDQVRKITPEQFISELPKKVDYKP